MGNGGTAAEGYAGAIALDVDGGVFHAGWNNRLRESIFRTCGGGGHPMENRKQPLHMPPSYLLVLNSSGAYLPLDGDRLANGRKIVVAGSAAHTSVSTDTDFFYRPL